MNPFLIVHLHSKRKELSLKFLGKNGKKIKATVLSLIRDRVSNKL